MEIRNALIMLTKVSSVFPVSHKSGINLEKQVGKVKGDEREDLKVLATVVAATLVARKPSWVIDDEFGMGYLEIKSVSAHASKFIVVNSVSLQNGTGAIASHAELTEGRNAVTGTIHSDYGNSDKDLRTRPAEGRIQRTESALKSDLGSTKLKNGSLVNCSELQSCVPSSAVQLGTSRSAKKRKQSDDPTTRLSGDTMKMAAKTTANPEGRATGKRSFAVASLSKPSRQDLAKDDSKSVKAAARISSSSVDKDPSAHSFEGKQSGTANVSLTTSGNCNLVSNSHKVTPSLRSLDHGSESKVEIANAKSADSKVPAGKDDAVEDLDAVKSS